MGGDEEPELSVGSKGGKKKKQHISLQSYRKSFGEKRKIGEEIYRSKSGEAKWKEMLC